MNITKAKALIIGSLIILTFSISFEASSQNPDTILLRKTYSHVPFVNFAAELEREYGIRIFYEKEWVRNILVEIPQTGISVSEAIGRVLSRNSFTYEIFDGSDFIIIPADHKGQSGNSGSTSGVINVGNPAEKGRYKTAEITGQVLEGETGMPIPGAVVYIEDTKEGITTGKDGKYAIKVSTGEHSIKYSFIGLEEKKQAVIVYENGSLNIELFEKSFALEEVVVKETRRDQNIVSTGMGSIKMDSKTIQKLPVLMGETDVIKSLTLLPGVVTAGEGTGGFNVRGGNADQNLILMDGAAVYNPSHLFGMFSIINPEAIKDVTLMKGDIPASYGGRTSSLMDINMKNGNNKSYHADGGIGPLNSKIMVEGPFASNKGSFLFGARSTYSDWILKQLPDINLRNSRASFYDFNAKINFIAGENDHFSLFGYQSSDQFQFASSSEYAYQNRLGSFNWNHYFSRQLYSSVTASYSHYQFQFEDKAIPVQASRMESSINDISLRINFKYLVSDNHKIETGLDLTEFTFNPGKKDALNAASDFNSISLEQQFANQGSVYISDEWTVNSKLTVSAGLRYSQFYRLGPYEEFGYEPGKSLTELTILDTISYGRGKVIKSFGSAEPRIGIKIAVTDKSSIKASYNRHVQYIHMISNSAAVAPTDMWQGSGTYIRPEIADQFAIGYYKNFEENMYESSVEFYYKKYQNLIDYKNGASLVMNSMLETGLINSEGKSYGMELLIRKTSGRLTGWGGYTYSRAFIKSAGNFPDEIINRGEFYPTYYDRPHDLTIAMNYQLTRRWRVSGNFLYNTGRPITLPSQIYQYNNTELVYFADRNSSRMPDYHRLDLSLSLDGNLKKYRRWKSSWTISVYNVYGRKNAFSIFYQKTTPTASNNFENYGLYKLSIIGRPFPSITYNFVF